MKGILFYRTVSGPGGGLPSAPPFGPETVQFLRFTHSQKLSKMSCVWICRMDLPLRKIKQKEKGLEHTSSAKKQTEQRNQRAAEPFSF